MFLSSYCFLVERNYNKKGLKRKIIVGLPKHPASKITSVGNQDMAVKFVGLRQLSNLDVPPRYGEVTIVARPTHVQSSLSVPKSIYCKLAIMKPFLLNKKKQTKPMLLNIFCISWAIQRNRPAVRAGAGGFHLLHLCATILCTKRFSIFWFQLNWNHSQNWKFPASMTCSKHPLANFDFGVPN